MGYYSIVSGEITIKKELLEKMKQEVLEAKEKDGGPKAEWIDCNIAIGDFEDDVWMPNPEGEQYKWYGWDEYITWLMQYAESGKIVREGEESGDFEAYEWVDGKRYRLELVLQRIEF